jgi:hypothetical protein
MIYSHIAKNKYNILSRLHTRLSEMDRRKKKNKIFCTNTYNHFILNYIENSWGRVPFTYTWDSPHNDNMRWKPFDFKRTWRRLLKKSVVRTTFDIYVFNLNIFYSIIWHVNAMQYVIYDKDSETSRAYINPSPYKSTTIWKHHHV